MIDVEFLAGKLKYLEENIEDMRDIAAEAIETAQTIQDESTYLYSDAIRFEAAIDQVIEDLEKAQDRVDAMADELNS